MFWEVEDISGGGRTALSWNPWAREHQGELDADLRRQGCVFGEDQRGRGGCYHELTGKWQREFCGGSVSG